MRFTSVGDYYVQFVLNTQNKEAICFFFVFFFSSEKVRIGHTIVMKMVPIGLYDSPAVRPKYTQMK